MSTLEMVRLLPGRLLLNSVVSDFLITVLPGQSENVVKVKVKSTLEHATKAQREICTGVLIIS